MRRTRTRLLALLLVVTALAAACGDSDDETASSDETPSTTATPAGSTEGSGTTEAGPAQIPDGPTITIGAQDFGESAILAQVYGQALSAAGYPVKQQELGGFRDIVYSSFANGDIDFTVEYVSSTLEFLNSGAGEASNDLDASVEALRTQLKSKGLQALEPADAQDSNVFVVTPETAESKGLTAISDMTPELRLGGPPNCEQNAACIPGLREVYGIDMSSNFTPLDGGGPLTVAALDGGQIDVAILFSTNPQIADNGWKVLDDDKGLINVENIIPVTTDAVVQAYGQDMAAVVDGVSAALTTEELAAMNKRFDVDHDDADVIAKEWLTEQGLMD
jgi:osmoprotectant transport system substrate-binding protein